MEKQFLVGEEEENTGLLIHGGVLAVTVLSGGTLGLICSLVAYFVYRNNSSFLRKVSSDAVNVQLSGFIYAFAMLVAAVVGGFMSLSGSRNAIIFTIVFLILFALLGLYFFAAHIVCALKAKRGIAYTPPLTLRIVK